MVTHNPNKLVVNLQAKGVGLERGEHRDCASMQAYIERNL